MGVWDHWQKWSQSGFLQQSEHDNKDQEDQLGAYQWVLVVYWLIVFSNELLISTVQKEVLWWGNIDATVINIGRILLSALLPVEWLWKPVPASHAAILGREINCVHINCDCVFALVWYMTMPKTVWKSFVFAEGGQTVWVFTFSLIFDACLLSSNISIVSCVK